MGLYSVYQHVEPHVMAVCGADNYYCRCAEQAARYADLPEVEQVSTVRCW